VFMKLLRLIAPLGAFVLLPHIVQAQQFGFSVGSPSVGSAAHAAPAMPAPSSSTASPGPALPALPSHLPVGSSPAVPSTSLQPLNLESTHMAPILHSPAVEASRLALPAVPFALDRVLRAPQMCVDPHLLQH
jgi:hypothetical protein